MWANLSVLNNKEFALTPKLFFQFTTGFNQVLKTKPEAAEKREPLLIQAYRGWSSVAEGKERSTAHFSRPSSPTSTSPDSSLLQARSLNLMGEGQQTESPPWHGKDPPQLEEGSRKKSSTCGRRKHNTVLDPEFYTSNNRSRLALGEGQESPTHSQPQIRQSLAAMGKRARKA